MQVPARLVVALLTLVALAAGGCGGGDGASTSPATAKVLAGAFGAAKPMRSGSGRVRFDLVFADLDQAQAIGPPAHPRPVSELAAAMRRVLGGNRRYTRCLQDADADLAKAQACADLVGQ
jgi:hypothetical protein